MDVPSPSLISLVSFPSQHTTHSNPPSTASTSSPSSSSFHSPSHNHKPPHIHTPVASPSHSHSHSLPDNFSSNGQSYVDPPGFDIESPIISDDSLDCIGAHVQPPQTSHPMITRVKDGIFKPNVYTLSTGSDVEPSNHIEALSDPNWKATMEVEYAILMKNDTWDLTVLPHTHINRLQMGA